MYDQRVGTGGRHLVSVNRCKNELTHKRVLWNVVCDAPELRSSLGPTDLVLSIWGFSTGLNSREMVDPVCYIRNAHDYDAHSPEGLQTRSGVSEGVLRPCATPEGLQSF